MRTLELEEIAEMLHTKMLDIAQRIHDVDEQKFDVGPQSPRAPGRTPEGRTKSSMDVTSSPAG